MKLLTLTLLATLAWGTAAQARAQAQVQPAAPAAASCNPGTLDVGGNALWVDKQGSGATTVVFESGFGNDSNVWSKIAPRIREAGAQTLVYDRAGMGKSRINTAAPYSVDNDVHILRTVLTACGVTGPVLMVGHSYGGGMALLAASLDSRVQGVVLLDSVVPGVWGQGELEKNLSAMRAQFDDIRKQAPELAKVAIPWAEALPQTVQRFDSMAIPAWLPIIDIVAENGQKSPASAQVWREAHRALTANNPQREFVLAQGSSHKVMADKPDLVVDAIQRMLGKLKQPP